MLWLICGIPAACAVNSADTCLCKAETEGSNDAFRFNEWDDQLATHEGPARHHPITFSIGGFGYVMGGNYEYYTSNSNFDMHRFQPGKGWTKLSLPNPAPDGPRGYSYGVELGGLGYLGFGIVNGRAKGDWWNYNPTLNKFTELKKFPGLERWHPAMVAIEIEGESEAVEQLIYVGCGSSPAGNRKDWWEYRVSSDSWIQRADLPGPPRHHPYYWSAKIGDRMFAFVGFGHGSWQDGSIFKDVYRYDPLSLEWTRMKDFPGEARVAGTQFSYKSHGYILSGDGDDHSYMPTGEMHEYDATKDTWQKLPPHLGKSRWAPGCFVIGSSVYFTGGLNKATWQYPKHLQRYSLCECRKETTTTQIVTKQSECQAQCEFPSFPQKTHIFMFRRERVPEEQRRMRQQKKMHQHDGRQNMRRLSIWVCERRRY